jgi:predicted RNA-binding protein
MCEANAYMIKDGKEETLMKAVDVVEPDGENVWRLIDIFGDQKIIHGHIKGMSLVDHKILFEQ